MNPKMYQNAIPIQNQIVQDNDVDSIFNVFSLEQNKYHGDKENLEEISEMGFTIRKHRIHMSSLNISESELEKEVYKTLKQLKYLSSDEYHHEKNKLSKLVDSDGKKIEIKNSKKYKFNSKFKDIEFYCGGNVFVSPIILMEYESKYGIFIHPDFSLMI